MFTGIVEEIGELISVKSATKSSVLEIRGNLIFGDLKTGDSVAVNGVCLTVASLKKNAFMADVMSETLKRSSLKGITLGAPVNLERAMPANGRFGGHMVSGHIDGTGEIVNITREDNAVWFTVKTSDKIMSYIVEKGSIAVDGISLTVAKLENNQFSVSTIPHTVKLTVLFKRGIGSQVNLENDIAGKYIEKFMQNKTSNNQQNKTNNNQQNKINNDHSKTGVTVSMLEKAGF